MPEEALAAIQAAQSSARRAELDLVRQTHALADAHDAARGLRAHNAANHYDRWLEDFLLGAR